MVFLHETQPGVEYMHTGKGPAECRPAECTTMLSCMDLRLNVSSMPAAKAGSCYWNQHLLLFKTNLR